MGKKVFRSGFVGIVGRPNVGKSTLMNHLIGQKIAITSAKPQTTRNQIRTVYTSGEGQIIFLDTPGIHKAQNRLGQYMDDVAYETLSQVDVILWIVEPTNFSGAGERLIASKLTLTKKPVILVMNKIDTVDRKNVPEYIKLYRKLYPFDEIIPVSALRSVNTDSVLEAIFARLPEGPMYYDEETVTDQTMRTICAEIIREKALRCLKDEVPHGIAVEIQSMKERKLRPGRRSRAQSAALDGAADGKPGTDLDGAAGRNPEPAKDGAAGRNPEPAMDGAAGRNPGTDLDGAVPAGPGGDMIWDIEAVIITEKDSHKGIIIGRGGSMLKKIATQSRLAIEEMAQEQVNLKVFVKVRKDWKDNAGILRSLGYDSGKGRKDP